MTPSGVRRVERILEVFTGGKTKKPAFAVANPAARTYTRKTVPASTPSTTNCNGQNVKMEPPAPANTSIIDEEVRPCSPSLLSIDNSFFNDLNDEEEDCTQTTMDDSMFL